MIPQDPMLFHRSLMENIRYGRLDASDDDVIDAAKKAHAHEFILQTETGYESLVGERGVKLSGGQRQRLSLARALLKDPPILVLDEATAMFDPDSEQDFIETFRDQLSQRTVILITHRPASLALADRVIAIGGPSR